MYKTLLFCLLLFKSFAHKAQTYCTPMVAPIVSYPPNTTNVGGTGTCNLNAIQYLCGPNTVLYDTTWQAGCWSVYVNNNSTLYLKPINTAYQEIWLKSTSTLNIINSASTVYVYAEAGAVINQPTAPHLYTIAIFTCPSITFPVGNCATDLAEINAEYKIDVLPNPTHSILNIIDEQGQFQNSAIDLKNYFGQTILNIPFSKQLDITDLASGIYFLTLQTKENKKTIKIIKE